MAQENSAAPATEAVEKVKPVRFAGNISPELAAWLHNHRFDERVEKPDLLEHVLMKYAVAHGYSPKV